VSRRTRKYTGPERRKKQRWRPKPLRVFLSLIALVAIGYAIAVLSLIGEESSLVFEAGRTLGSNRPPFPYEQIDLPRADGLRQFAWIMRRGKAANAPWALFLHGNASTIASNVSIAHYRVLRDLGLNVLAPEYRGFGGLNGTPTEESLEGDVRVAYEYLRATRKVSPARIVIYGWSLGSALAIDLASSTEHAALILEAAPASQTRNYQHRYPLFPVRLVIRNQFDSLGKIERVRSPILFLHSPEDAVVPIAEGRRLFDAATGDKAFVEIRGGHLNASDEDAEHVHTVLRTFLQQHGLVAASVNP